MSNEENAQDSVLQSAGSLRGSALGIQRERFSRIVLLVFLLVLSICSLSIFSTVQMSAAFRELRRTVEDLVPFIELTRKVTFAQARQASDMRLALMALKDDRVNLNERREIFTTQVEALKSGPRIVEYYDQSKELLAKIESHEQIDLDGAKLAELANLLKVLRDRQIEYEELVNLLSSKLIVASIAVITNQITQAELELAEKQEVIDQVSRTISANIGELLAETVSARYAFQTSARMVSALFAVVSVIIAGYLLLRIRRMQKQLVRSEQFSVLAQTLVTLHHEINNPLAVIVGNAGLLASNKELKSDHHKMLAEINEMALRINAVLNKLGQMQSITTTEYVSGTQMLKLEPEVGKVES